MKKPEYRKMHSLESGYWWYVALHRLVLDVLNKKRIQAPKNESDSFRVLDAGCGTGRLLELMNKNGFAATGVDASPEAIRFCRKRGLTRVKMADLNRYDPPQRLDAITCLDVLYHRWIRREKKVLKTFHQSLRPGGSLILQLPAFPCLAGAHDLAVDGARRYLRGDILKHLKQCGFRIHRASYRISFLFFPVWIRRSLERWGVWPAGTSDLKALPSWINFLLQWMSHLENGLVKAGVVFPIGVSLFVVAEKNKSV